MAMKIEYSDRFQENGCNYYQAGNGLAIIRYWDEYSDRNGREHLQGFGSGNVFDYSEKAKLMLQAAHGDKFELLLSIPVTVARIKSSID